MPWVDVYAGLAEKFQWEPWTVDRLTMYQALVYMGARDRQLSPALRPSTPEEVRQYVQKHGIQRHGV